MNDKLTFDLSYPAQRIAAAGAMKALRDAGFTIARLPGVADKEAEKTEEKR